VHQFGPKDTGSQNFSFLALKAEPVGEVQILRNQYFPHIVIFHMWQVKKKQKIVFSHFSASKLTIYAVFGLV
jgi:hypothetical protein